MQTTLHEQRMAASAATDHCAVQERAILANHRFEFPSSPATAIYAPPQIQRPGTNRNAVGNLKSGCILGLLNWVENCGEQCYLADGRPCAMT